MRRCNTKGVGSIGPFACVIIKPEPGAGGACLAWPGTAKER
jgi:hypothetical protein